MTQTIPVMRISLLVGSFLVLAMSILLTIFADQTEMYFSWTINPPLTAAFLGASYGASFILGIVASFGKNWAESRLAVPSSLIFTILTFVASLLHLDKFHLDAPQMITIFLTWTWLLVYGIVPITMSLSLFLQIRTTGNPSPSRINPLPTLLRRLVFVQGTVMLLFGIGLFIFPATFIPFWIWQLSALTGRAIAAWLIGYGILALQLAWEDEQSRSDFAFLSYFIFSTLQLLTLLRYSSTVDWGTIGLWLYLAFLVSMIVVGAWGWQVGRKARQAS